MNAIILAMLVCATSQPWPMHFIFPDDVCDAQGITFEAQRPETGLTLIGKDTTRPKLWYAPVASDTKDGRVHLWYQRIDSAEKDFSDQRVLCLGELYNDAWRIPTLHDSPPPWGGPNNICMRRSPFKPTWGGFNVFQLVHDNDQLQMLYWDQPAEQGDAGAMLASSPDGLVWTKDPVGTVFTEHNDAFTLIKIGSEYLLYQTVLEDWPDKPYPDNLDKKRRVQSLRTSPDLRTWTPQNVFLRPDAEDKPETEFYVMKAFPYGSAYAGILFKYYADPQLPNKHSAIYQQELIISRDARHWLRPFRNTDIGFFSYADPFIFQGRLHFATWSDGAMATRTCAPRRLIAAVANDQGSFTSPVFSWPEKGIATDADARGGWIEAERLDAAGKAARLERLTDVNGEALPLSTTARPGEPARMRFRMHAARLFAIVPATWNQPL